MRIFICLPILVLMSISNYSCNNDKYNMTEIEKRLINNGSADSSFYVLQTTEELDSLFLRMKCKDIDPKKIADKDIQLLITRMKATLFEEEGVGLAAPQIGISRNIFLFMRIDQEEHTIDVAINPKIVKHAEETICFEGDGCLSIPNISGNSIRYPWIEVEYYNEKGELKKEKLSGHSRDADFTGVIFQHEFDHLEGVLFIDKLCEEETASQQKTEL